MNGKRPIELGVKEREVGRNTWSIPERETYLMGGEEKHWEGETDGKD